MVALLGQLARDLPAFAPDLVSDPRVCLFPYLSRHALQRRQASAEDARCGAFPYRDSLQRATAPGMYVEISPQWVWMGGGIYMPSSPEAAVNPRVNRGGAPQVPPHRDGVHLSRRRRASWLVSN
jgi:hypothetical protein